MSKTKTTLTGCILQATKMCANVQILFQHKKQDDSVISLKCVKLLGLGSVSNVAPKPEGDQKGRHCQQCLPREVVFHKIT